MTERRISRRASAWLILLMLVLAWSIIVPAGWWLVRYAMLHLCQ